MYNETKVVSIIKNNMFKNKKLTSQLTWLLVVVGALNWGIMGISALAGKPNVNVVHMILEQSATLEAIVYAIVGVAGASFLFKGPKCMQCGR